MVVLDSIAALGRAGEALHAAIGVFDGVHRGHQAVIDVALDSAATAGGRDKACVITFDPHPARVLAPDSAPRLLTSTRHKLQLLADTGIGLVAMLPFDRELASTPAEDFVRQLCQAGRPLRRICVGAGWRFGKGGGGDVALLERLGGELGFAVTGVPVVEVDGVPASSTRIREAVAAGELEIAERLLGRPYTVLGSVVEGRRLGRQLGFPTANLTAHSEQLPPAGVWAVGVARDGQEQPGVANLGYRPSVERGEAPRRLLEVHLFDWSGDLYGQDLEVRFLRHLRAERRFAGLEELKAQIARDAAAAREICAAAGIAAAGS